ncbi:MAG: PH domain-containing protein, partial [Dermabacteraceae bacterium]
MTIPRQIGPETGPRTALPDYSRSSSTVERMVSELQRSPGRKSAAGGTVRALFPAAATRDTALRAAVAAVLLGGALIASGVSVLLLASLELGRSPGIGMLMLLLALG